ncbi:LysM peptidoglycan-binding domain-containing M23 family metallopeptidase [Streptomyces sp. NPDC003042]
MPSKGKHRRPKSRSISRGLAVAGTGGAALALPLMGAAGAHAAAPAVVPAAAPVQAAQLPQAPQAAPAAALAAAPTVYTVAPGDYLSKIAAERQLSGGWEQLYADNREAVGSNPSLIHPGLKLTLGGQSQAAAEPAPSEKPKEPKKAKEPKKRQAPATPSSAGKASAPEWSSTGSSASGEAASGAGTAPAKTSGSGFVSPVSGGISTPYRMGGSMWSSGYHTGVDFMASSGTTVKAVGAGTVVSAGWGGSYGNEVIVKHADGKYSQYAHLSSLAVSVGQSVTGGQSLGLSGSTGNSTGPHLHFEIRTGPSYGSDIDPVAYLRTKGVSI